MSIKHLENRVALSFVVMGMWTENIIIDAFEYYCVCNLCFGATVQLHIVEALKGFI